MVEWKRFSELSTKSKFVDLHEIAYDINTLKLSDDFFGIAPERTTKFLSFREKHFFPAVDLFRDRHEEIYLAVMMTVGTERHTFKRKVPTIIDSLSKAGGLYYSVLFIALAFTFVFFKPIDDLNLLKVWKRIKKLELDANLINDLTQEEFTRYSGIFN